jgi:hypothetical protein
MQTFHFYAELRYPGSTIAIPNPGAAEAVNRLLRLIETSLVDATLGANYFESTVAAGTAPLSDPTEGREEIVELEKKGVEPAEARHQVFSRKWQQGEVPNELLHREAFVHARTFLGALEGIAAALRQLEQIDEVSGLASNAREAFEREFPELHGVRNSIQHADERVLLKGPKKNAPPITPQPLATTGYRIEGPSFDNLMFRRYTTLLADGRQGSVEVSRLSLDKVASCIQDLLDALPWEAQSRQRFFPHW